MLDFTKPLRGDWVLKSRGYEKELAKRIGGKFVDEKLFDIMQGRTRYEVKKQQGNNLINIANYVLFYKTKKRYKFVFLYYDKATKTVEEVYIVKPIDLIEKLNLTKPNSGKVNAIKKIWGQALVQVPIKKSMVREIAQKKIMLVANK